MGALGTIGLAAFVYICLCEPFPGFGVHDVVEQFFRLICGIIAPVALMAVTDYFINAFLGRKKLACIAVAVEAVLSCAKYCYTFLRSIDNSFLDSLSLRL